MLWKKMKWIHENTILIQCLVCQVFAARVGQLLQSCTYHVEDRTPQPTKTENPNQTKIAMVWLFEEFCNYPPPPKRRTFSFLKATQKLRCILRPNPHRTRRKQMGPVDVNGDVHTAGKQHQKKNVPICMCIASRVLFGLGLNQGHLNRFWTKLEGRQMWYVFCTATTSGIYRPSTRCVLRATRIPAFSHFT